MIAAILAYVDPVRKVGSQSETPALAFRHGTIAVRGYQSYNVESDGRLSYIRKPFKFKTIQGLLERLHADGCDSLVDIGCNAGLVSLIASRVGYSSALGLDHDPEYISVFRRVIEATNSTGLNASVFSFGGPVPTAADVVFCGAIIHWVLCLTADFSGQGFGGILRYLLRYASRYLLIEWVDPSDNAIKGFRHIARCGKGLEADFTVENFERAVATQATVERKIILDSTSRVLYVLRPGAPSGSEKLTDKFLIDRASTFSRVKAGCDGEEWVLSETRKSRLEKVACYERYVTHAGTCDTATQALVLPRDICPTDRIELTFKGAETRLALPTLQPAVTSGTWVDKEEKIVVKQVYAFKSWQPVRREACLLEKLHRFRWAPELLCFNGDTLVMQHVGKRVSRATLPADYKHQVRTMLEDMQSLGIRHNDIASPYRVDLMVNTGGEMSLVDFGFASVGTDFSANCSGVPSKIPCFTPKRDADVLKALAKMAKRKGDVEN